MSTREAVIELFGEETTLSERQRLLRTIRDTVGEDVVRVPRRADDALEEIRKAVRAGHLLPEQLVAALQDAEENGNQHIMYYVSVKDKTRIFADGEAVAQAIFGATDWYVRQGFPNLASPTGDAFEWADFRIGLPGKPHDWVAKFYTPESREEPVPAGEVQAWITAQTGVAHDGAGTDLTSDEHVQAWITAQIGVAPNPAWRFNFTRPVRFRSVLLARWNHPGILELRVSRRGLDSRTTLATREEAIWTRLARAIKKDDLSAWDLGPVRSNMVRAEARGGMPFRTSRTTLRTALGTHVAFERPTDEEAMSADEVASRSIAGLMSDGGRNEVLTVNFLADRSDDALEQDLLVIAGVARAHEVVIRAQSSARAIDYVTDQFRAHR
ncbi:MAG TPA: hypothetical protein VGE74_17265 [Gemmata sp.]